jgi:tetratricopeptide (TPR) repeat protein
MTEAVDTLFEQAVEALRQDDRVRARELLTRLIKANQKDVNYWIWMSAAVDTPKERVYCLETALKLDPENEIAKRGLMLIGARPPERDVKPFSIHRARVWEDNLFLANEAPHQTGFRGFMANPATRLAATVITGAMLISVVVLFGINQQAAVFQPGALLPAGPTAAFTATPTFANISQPRGGTPNVPTPLAVVLGISYTPTPLYVNTPRAPAGADIYRAAQAAHARGDWDAYMEGMLQVQQMEPTAPDIQYEIGERYRLAGDCTNALFYFNESLKINDAFAPSYLGLARARLCSDPGADVRGFYQMARTPTRPRRGTDRAVRHWPERRDDALLRAGRRWAEFRAVQVGLARST